MTFSATDGTRISPRLHAEAFGLAREEARTDIEMLLAGGAFPLTLSEGDTLLSQGFALPLVSEGIPLLYLYALATLPAARGQGHLRTLLERTAATARREGYHALALLPASEALAAAYTRMGFSEARPAGGAAAIQDPRDLALLRLREGTPTPLSRGCALTAFSGTLPEPLLAFAIDTLAPDVLPYRVGDTAYLLLARDTRYALAANRSNTVRKHGVTHRLLLRPLGGALPMSIPEPLPR